MVASYPVNDYRGYLAHKAPSFSNAANWNEADQHKYYKREWTGNGWRYYYTRDEYERAKKEESEAPQRARAEKAAANQPKGFVETTRALSTNKEKMKTQEDEEDSTILKSARDMPASQLLKNRVAQAELGISNTMAEKFDSFKAFTNEQAKVYEDPDYSDLDENGAPVKHYANTIAGNTVRIATAIASWAATAFSNVKSWIKGTAANVKSWGEARVKELKGYYKSAQEYVNGIAGKLMNNKQVAAVVGTISSAFTTISSGLVDAYNGVAGFVRSMPDLAASAIGALTDIFGITNRITRTMDASVSQDALNNEPAENFVGAPQTVDQQNGNTVTLTYPDGHTEQVKQK